MKLFATGLEAQEGQRELILLQGRATHIARYFYLPSADVVFVRRVCDSREGGDGDK